MNYDVCLSIPTNQEAGLEFWPIVESLYPPYSSSSADFLFPVERLLEPLRPPLLYDIATIF